MLLSLFTLAAASFFSLATGLASTDSYRDADVGQAGYLDNHNMDPAVVDSAQFGQLWKIAFHNLEQGGAYNRAV